MRWLLLSLALIVHSVGAKTSLWEVSNGTHRLFLGGTVHMLSPADFPLPVEFDQAYNAADRLVFETDLQRLAEPRFKKLLMERVGFPPGISLRSQKVLWLLIASDHS